MQDKVLAIDGRTHPHKSGSRSPVAASRTTSIRFAHAGFITCHPVRAMIPSGAQQNKHFVVDDVTPQQRDEINMSLLPRSILNAALEPPDSKPEVLK